MDPLLASSYSATKNESAITLQKALPPKMNVSLRWRRRPRPAFRTLFNGSALGYVLRCHQTWKCHYVREGGLAPHSDRSSMHSSHIHEFTEALVQICPTLNRKTSNHKTGDARIHSGKTLSNRVPLWSAKTAIITCSKMKWNKNIPGLTQQVTLHSI